MIKIARLNRVEKKASVKSLPAPIRHRTILFALVVFSFSVASAFAATIDVTAYGANGNDTSDDTVYIRSAVAALTDGDTLLFPEANTYYKVAIGANFAIGSRIKVIIRGRILAYGTPGNDDNIFYVFGADDTEFIGQGSNAIIEGSNQYQYNPNGWYGPSLSTT